MTPAKQETNTNTQTTNTKTTDKTCGEKKVKRAKHSCVELHQEARNSSTPHPPLPLPSQWPGLSLWQVPPYFLSIISPPFAHPHGPAPFTSLPPLYPTISHSPLRPGLSLWQVLPLSHLPTSSSPLIPLSSLYLPPIPITPARLVIVAGPA